LAVAVEDGRVVGFVSAVHYVHPDKPRPGAVVGLIKYGELLLDNQPRPSTRSSCSTDSAIQLGLTRGTFSALCCGFRWLVCPAPPNLLLLRMCLWSTLRLS